MTQKDSNHQPPIEPKELNVGFIVKLNFLVLGLILVIYFMFDIKASGLPDSAKALFGLQGAQDTQVTHKLKWCDTRVSFLEFPNRFRLEQQKMKWIKTGSQNREVDFIAVEKWFGRNCDLNVQAVENTSPNLGELTPVMKVGFIKGPMEIFYKTNKGTFYYQGQLFLSPQLSQAIDKIAKLPTATIK